MLYRKFEAIPIKKVDFMMLKNLRNDLVLYTFFIKIAIIHYFVYEV